MSKVLPVFLSVGSDEVVTLRVDEKGATLVLKDPGLNLDMTLVLDDKVVERIVRARNAVERPSSEALCEARDRLQTAFAEKGIPTQISIDHDQRTLVVVRDPATPLSRTFVLTLRQAEEQIRMLKRR